MDDLVAFLNARLDEDEAVALTSKNAPADALRYLDADKWTQELTWLADEDRVLREVEAKRAVLLAYEMAAEHLGEESPVTRTMRNLVRAQVTVYSDYPDYRQEWKP